MVKRGILLILAGLFWCGGATIFYWYGDGVRAIPEVDVPEITLESPFQFPFAVPGTDLIALELTSYDGLYLEDGSVERVSGISALVLQNSGTQMLEKADIELYQGDRKLKFILSYLPAGQKILVLENERCPYESAGITNCFGRSCEAPKDIPGLVTVRETQGRFLLISNPGPIPLKNVTVYYKTYDSDSDMFLGGIAYELSIYRIAPGDTYIAQPGYYDSEESRIVKIKTSGQ